MILTTVIVTEPSLPPKHLTLVAEIVRGPVGQAALDLKEVSNTNATTSK